MVRGSRTLRRNDDVSTLMTLLVRYGSDSGIADEQLRKWLLEIPLAFLEFETGFNRHTNRASKKRPTSTPAITPSKIAQTLLDTLEAQSSVQATECKRVRKTRFHDHFPGMVRNDVEVTGGIGRREIRRGRQHAVPERQNSCYGF